MTLPSINIIRQTLADIEGAVIDEPRTSTVGTGDLPHVLIHQPTERSREMVATEADPGNPLTGDGPHPEVSTMRIFLRSYRTSTTASLKKRWHDTAVMILNA